MLWGRCWCCGHRQVVLVVHKAQQPHGEEHEWDAVLRAVPWEFGNVGSLGKLVPLQMKHFFPYSNGVNEEIKLCLEPLPAVGKTERAGDAALPGQEERGSGGWSRGCAHQGAVMGMNRRLVEGKCQ